MTTFAVGDRVKFEMEYIGVCVGTVTESGSSWWFHPDAVMVRWDPSPSFSFLSPAPGPWAAHVLKRA